MLAATTLALVMLQAVPSSTFQPLNLRTFPRTKSRQHSEFISKIFGGGGGGSGSAPAAASSVEFSPLEVAPSWQDLETSASATSTGAKLAQMVRTSRLARF